MNIKRKEKETRKYNRNGNAISFKPSDYYILYSKKTVKLKNY